MHRTSRTLRRPLSTGRVALISLAAVLAVALALTVGRLVAPAAQSLAAPVAPAVPGGALAAPAAPIADDLPSAVEAASGAVAAAGGSLRVAVGDPTGALLAAADADRPAYTASLVKLLVVAELLERSSSGPRRAGLAAADRRGMERAIELSDDLAMDALWVEHDGPALVRSAIADFGLTGTAGTRVPGQWGQTTTTAADLVTFLTGLDHRLGPAGAETLRGWMRAAAPTAADGFDQAFGLFSPDLGPAGTAAVKQGWMCCVAGERTLSSAGILPGGTVVVLLGSFPEAVPWETARSLLDAAGRWIVAALP